VLGVRVMKDRKTLKLGKRLSPEDIERTIEEALDEAIEDVVASFESSSDKKAKVGERK